MENKIWFKICEGERGKRSYVVSESFWNWMRSEIKKSIKYGSKRELVRKIINVTNNQINQRAIENWIYRFGKTDGRKPMIIPDNRIFKINRINGDCIHGYKMFCPVCKISKRVEDCPVPLLWKTDNKGKIYAFNEFWYDFIDVLQNCEQYGLLPSNIRKGFNIDSRVFRKWRNGHTQPHLYSEKEFRFTPENLYWLGIHFSDGHIRNNGSKLSFTWQVGSSNPFQGYWFPQFIQNYMDIFLHKKNRSLTYLQYSKSAKSWFFRTNISSFSPIFAKSLESSNIIERIKNTPTSGYSKNLPKDFVKKISDKEILFQGIMDGDGSYNISDGHGMFIYLSLHPSVNYDFIRELPLVPTTSKDWNKNYGCYEELSGTPLEEIRFAPSSLSSLPKKYSVIDIVNQFEFMLKAAENSIRPDKVHTLIEIIKRISSKEYGEYRSCLEVQKDIRDECRKRNLLKFTKSLEKRFPVLNGFYKSFTPKWAETFTSKASWKEEFWGFFLDGTFLKKKNYPKPKLLDFSEGVPVDFDMTAGARI